MLINRTLFKLFFVIVLLVIGGSTGYYILFNGEPKFIDCLYMTVISLTSVGYGEVLEVSGNVPAQIFTMVLITFGMGILLYAISSVTAILIEGELSGLLRKRKMQKKIDKLSEHFIVCGGGETSKPLIEELIQNFESVVLIESDVDRIEKCMVSDQLLFVAGDPTDDQNLIAAGIERARGILIVLNSDKETLYVTMTARMMNKTIRIISQMTDQAIEAKLLKAGANRVISPNIIGGLRMASEMIRPTAVDFLDQMLRSEKGNLRIHEIVITETTGILGKKIMQSGLKDKFDLLILGAKNPDGIIEFNPSPTRTIAEGMTLIVMGSIENIDKVRRSF
ncbi:MAG: potassium channel protein [Proteobacteria bacterium]|nr:potassium channel protein [Pseudomonadota bacterium]